MFRPEDKKWMSRALWLAAEGGNRAHPNPRVGCVIVRAGKVVGEGRHVRFGGSHAEVQALRQAGSRARGSTLYVTLEPCPHWGKTPPCAETVARAGLRRVVVSTSDPSPGLKGRGLAFLRRAGVRVESGLMTRRAEDINRGFFQRQRLGRPQVVLKMAQTLDGKIASRTGASRWITGPRARALVHSLRAESDAVLVGGETVRRDNPLLTAHGHGPDPVRVILSGSLDLDVTSNIFGNEAPTWIFTKRGGSRSRTRALEKAGAQVIPVSGKGNELNPGTVLAALGRRGITRLLVEGGGRVAGSFLRAGLVDEAYLFVAPHFLGGDDAPSTVRGTGWASPGQGPRLMNADVKKMGGDWLIHGFFR